MDHLATRDVVIDNLTTNGVALTADVATRLVRNRAREVIVSLNAADAAGLRADDESQTGALRQGP